MLLSYVDRIFFYLKVDPNQNADTSNPKRSPTLLFSYGNMHALRFCMVMGYIGYQSCRDRRQECGILHTPTGKKLNLLLNPWLFASYSKICLNMWKTNKRNHIYRFIQVWHRGHHQE